MRRSHGWQLLLLLASLSATILLLHNILLPLPVELRPPVVTIHMTDRYSSQPMEEDRLVLTTGKESPLFPALKRFREVNISTVGLWGCQETQARHDPLHRATPPDFRPSMTSAERLVALYTLQAFIRALESKGLPYFLYGGSLLGSFRHHGFVPWDDDVDVMLNGSQKPEVRQALRDVHGFVLSTPPRFQWKFYPLWTRPLDNRNFRWPYVDIFFFAENATHVWDELPEWSDIVFPKQHVFPLTYRPFEGALVATPRRSGSVLAVNYYVNLCSPSSYCHKREESLDRARSLPCSQLRPHHPFVSRRRTEVRSVVETLVQGTQTLQEIVLADLE